MAERGEGNKDACGGAFMGIQFVAHLLCGLTHFGWGIVVCLYFVQLKEYGDSNHVSIISTHGLDVTRSMLRSELKRSR